MDVLKWAVVIFILCILLFVIIQNIGRAVTRMTPKGGINKELYVDINGTKQWISIYGKDIRNPVLLYLHGGPGYSPSYVDYGIFRRFSDVYTIVEWDERNCGKSSMREQNGIQITAEMMMQDGKEMTEFLCKYMNKKKITVMGLSWGALFGANLVLDYPEYYDAFIGMGQIVSFSQSNIHFKKYVLKCSENDPEMHKLAQSLSEKDRFEMSQSEVNAYFKIYSEYFPKDRITDGDISLFKGAIWTFFSPYHSIYELYRSIVQSFDAGKSEKNSYYTMFWEKDGCDSIALTGRFEYDVPFYLLMGDKDNRVMTEVAVDYFNHINAPYKKIMLTSGGHISPLINSGDLSDFIHEIANSQNRIHIK